MLSAAAGVCCEKKEGFGIEEEAADYFEHVSRVQGLALTRPDLR